MKPGVDDYNYVRHPPGHRVSESACERAHELGVPMRWVCRSSLRLRRNVLCPCVGRMPMSWVCHSSETEMERCVPLCGEDAHEMGVSFEMKRCVYPCKG